MDDKNEKVVFYLDFHVIYSCRNFWPEYLD